ncbi:MAG: SHOCT domain-containing protein [Lachnospiraceae bacterium]|nr:SHOCT domain-containing protein [Lachnospiraceae bacterium]
MSKKIHVRPGKTQSKVGFGAGVIFCLIGIFVVVPIFGPFGLLWTAMAGWITYSHYRNGFTDKPMDTKVIEIEDDGKHATVMSDFAGELRSYDVERDESGKEDVEERLKKLQNLYHQALITEEEYEQKKKEILDEL